LRILKHIAKYTRQRGESLGAHKIYAQSLNTTKFMRKALARNLYAKF